MMAKILIISVILLGALGAPLHSLASPVTTEWVLVDDYAGTSVPPERNWYYSRIGTNRGEMGSGSYSVKLGNGVASIRVTNGWAGVWTSLIHNDETEDTLSPDKLLGSWIKSQYQVKITGIRIDLIDGSGMLKVELKDINQPVFTQTEPMHGGVQTIEVSVSISAPINLINWLVDGSGFAKVDKVWLKVQAPNYKNLAEMVFLFSYSALSQCYDHKTGLVRDRARWPAEDRAASPSMGTFALITAIAHDLGYLEESDAKAIVSKTREAFLGLPTYHNLVPHFLKNGDIEPGSEWSSIDTIIGLISSILACEALGLDTTDFENRLKGIDWAHLTDNHTRSVSWGYNYAGEKFENRIDVFGSEALITGLAYAAATGKICLWETHDDPPTWDGSGFNDQMADLFLPTKIRDAWGNNWISYKESAYNMQESYLNGKSAYLGLSACDVPNPWDVAEKDVYQAFGVGGHNQTPIDGQNLVGYTVIAPHYAAMISLEHGNDFENVFGFLVQQGAFSPLNNVESFGIDTQGAFKFNGMKGSWNLSLQAMGVARALSERGNYLPYRMLEINDLLKMGYDKVMPVKAVLTPVYYLLLFN